MKFFHTIHIRKRILGGMAAAAILLAAATQLLPPAAARVSAAVERKLPIYCVQTEEKKLSVSFDAA